jgi:hypothetical protein
MDEFPLVGVRESGIDDDPRFQCINVASGQALWYSWSWLWNMRCNVLHTEQMPFYLCGAHEYLYKKMQSSIEFKGLFQRNNKGKSVYAKEKL